MGNIQKCHKRVLMTRATFDTFATNASGQNVKVSSVSRVNNSNRHE